MTPTVADVIARRCTERGVLLERAACFVSDLDEGLGLVAAVVFGSVARGDFNDRSDIDVLLVVDGLPDHPADRQLLVGSPAPGGVEAVVWTPAEWAERRTRRDPVALDVEEHGVWLVGSLGALTSGRARQESNLRPTD